MHALVGQTPPTCPHATTYHQEQKRIRTCCRNTSIYQVTSIIQGTLFSSSRHLRHLRLGTLTKKLSAAVPGIIESCRTCRTINQCFFKRLGMSRSSRRSPPALEELGCCHLRQLLRRGCCQSRRPEGQRQTLAVFVCGL